MNRVTHDVINKLSKPQHSAVLSIYLPTHRHPTPPHMQEDQIRFKNALREARELLAENGIDGGAIHENLSNIQGLLDDPDFWKTTLEGLAIFISEEQAQMYHSPMEFEQSVVCDTMYDVAPLHMMHSLNTPVYVLALAMHESKLYSADAYGIEQIAIDLPKSPEDALNIDELHAGRTVKSHRGGMSAHGEGDSSEAGTHERLQYFRIIERTLLQSNKFDQKAPLLLAATDSEAGHFKSVTSLPSVLEHVLHGNYTATAPQDLFAAVWPIIRTDILAKDEKEIVERFGEYKGHDRASINESDIEKAAQEGRVETLLVNYIDETNDSVSDAASDSTIVIRTTTDASKVRLKRLIDLVYKQGGKIIGLDKDRMPEAAVAAALYRY